MQFDYFIGVDVSKVTLDFAVAKTNQILDLLHLTGDYFWADLGNKLQFNHG